MSLPSRVVILSLAALAGVTAACTSLLGDYDPGVDPPAEAGADHVDLPEAATDTLPTQPDAADAGPIRAITSIAAGGYASCAVTATGYARCWGAMPAGLGDKPADGGLLGTPRSLAPITVMNPDGTGALSGVRQIAISPSSTPTRFHTCALAETVGHVYCWGYDADGQLGGGTASTVTHPLPRRVVDETATGALSGVEQIAVGSGFSCARKTGGTVWCWGRNEYGQLGIGTTTPLLSAKPVEVILPTSKPLDGVTTIAAGTSHVCAARTDGSVYCWGWSAGGLLGHPKASDRAPCIAVDGGDQNPCNPSPTPVHESDGGAMLVGATKLGVTYQSSSIVRADHSLWIWGYLPSAAQGTEVPLKSAQIGVQEIAGGTYSRCYTLADRHVHCDGSNQAGQSGTAPSSARADGQAEVLISSGQVLDAVVQLAVGSSHVCALRDGGQVFCWGLNADFQLGHELISDTDPAANACATTCCDDRTLTTKPCNHHAIQVAGLQ